jgi:hypothetical protein
MKLFQKTVDLSDNRMTNTDIDQSLLDRIFCSGITDQCSKIVRVFKAFILSSTVGIVIEPLCATSLAGLIEHAGFLSMRLIRDIFFAMSDVALLGIDLPSRKQNYSRQFDLILRMLHSDRENQTEDAL